MSSNSKYISFQWVCIPFAWTHPAVQDIEMSDWTVEWVGEIGGGWWNWHYADYFLLLTFGGIPWQVTGHLKIIILTERRSAYLVFHREKGAQFWLT